MFNPFDIEGSVKSILKGAIKQASKASGISHSKVTIKVAHRPDTPQEDGVDLIFHLLDGNKQITEYCKDRRKVFHKHHSGKEKHIDLYYLMDSPVDILGQVKLSLGLLTNAVQNLAFKNEVQIAETDFRIYASDDKVSEVNMAMVVKTGEGVRDVRVVQFTMEEVIEAGNMEGIMQQAQQ